MKRCTRSLDWEDLQRRLEEDRRCFGFFHPSLPDEPLIFVEVALCKGLASSVQDLIFGEVEPDVQADTAVFYSISNCQRGLVGISFGNFLIKQVVHELAAEMPGIRRLCHAVSHPGVPEVAAPGVPGRAAGRRGRSRRRRELRLAPRRPRAAAAPALRALPAPREAGPSAPRSGRPFSPSKRGPAGAAQLDGRPFTVRHFPVRRRDGELRLRRGRGGGQPRGLRQRRSYRACPRGRGARRRPRRRTSEEPAACAGSPRPDPKTLPGVQAAANAVDAAASQARRPAT